MLRLPLVLFLLLLLPGAPRAFGVTLSLSESAAYVREHHPELAAARLRVAEAEGRLLGAGRLSNPELGVELKGDRHARQGTLRVSLDQRFPVTARLRLEKALSRQLVAAAELEIKEQERKLIAEAQTVMVRLLSLEAERALRSEQVAVAKRLADFATDRSGKGEVSPLDAAQVEMDYQRLRLEMRKLETEQVRLLGELKPLLGVEATTPLTISGSLPMPEMPARTSWEGRPDFRLAQTSEQAARTGVHLARANRWNDLSAGALWELEREEGERGLERTGFMGVQVSVPLPLWNRNQGEVAEKEAAALRATLETEALAARIANEVRAAREEMAANARLAQETQARLLPLVREHVARLENAYQTGQADLLTVLRARDQQIGLEVAALEAVRDFHLARIRYEATTAQHLAPARSSARPVSKNRLP